MVSKNKASIALNGKFEALINRRSLNVSAHFPDVTDSFVSTTALPSHDDRTPIVLIAIGPDYWR